MSRFTFFRQSGWMLIATVIGGGFMWAAHVFAAKDVSALPLGTLTDWLERVIRAPLDKGEYGLFYTLLTLLNYIGIPAAGLQTILAQQAAMAVTDSKQRQLRGVLQVLTLATFTIWLVAFAITFLLQDDIAAGLNINDRAALWTTLFAGLLMLWAPILAGVLQGQQNFLWLGWVGILGGLGRCLAIFVIVRLLGARTTGAMLAVLIGIAVVLAISFWQARGVLIGPKERFSWGPWLAQVVPLTLGIGATTFIMSADMILVRSVFTADQTGFYSAAGILGRALAYFTGPMAAVMFPKIVQAAARAERTDVVAQALGATALLGGLGALVLTIAPGLPLQIVYDPSYLFIKPLVPWFAWCVLPLTLANVLVNNLLARARFRVVPWLVLIALAYGGTLFALSGRLSTADHLESFKTIVRVLGGFGLVLLAVCGWFTWITTEHRHASTTAGAA